MRVTLMRATKPAAEGGGYRRSVLTIVPVSHILARVLGAARASPERSSSSAVAACERRSSCMVRIRTMTSMTSATHCRVATTHRQLPNRPGKAEDCVRAAMASRVNGM